MTYRFENLEAWQHAMTLCEMVYEETKRFPREEIYGLSSQLRRAATSIPLNIAEGSACKSRKGFEQFLYVALRSQYEVVTILKLAEHLGYLRDKNLSRLEEQVARTGRLVQGLINSLQRNSNVQQPKTNNQQP